MIHTENFKTRTEIRARQNPKKQGFWDIGLDIGYSGVKGFSPNKVFCFPAFAKKVPEGLVSIAKPSDKDIQYKNLETGDIWDVGEAAQARATTNDSELALFGRVRYYNEMFQVLAKVGFALSLMKNKFGAPGGEDIISVETGLPPEYIKSDANILKEALAGQHHFALKIGSGQWQEFHFTITEKQIDVMDQPMGTLVSVSTASNGKPSADAQNYFSSKVIIMDAGFGTLDIYNIDKGKIQTKPETIDDMGMKQVFKNTIADIYDLYEKEITIPGMQELLESGEIKVRKKAEKHSNTRAVGTARVNFSDYLEKNSKNVCISALNHICDTYGGLIDHDYLIITGGTCAAWAPIIREYFGANETLTILSGAHNDDLPAIYANVRGYYMFALNRHR